jgi:hypothetical protein
VIPVISADLPIASFFPWILSSKTDDYGIA